VSSTGAPAAAARREFRETIDRPGHAVDNARTALATLEEAFTRGDLERTADLQEAIADLALALSQPDGQKLGGKSAEAARFIGRHIARLLDDA
jgi:hypothetical protein